MTRGSVAPAVRVVILGAGFGGLQVAHDLDPLAAQGKLEVTLIDRASHFQLGFALQWALDGRRPPEGGRRAYPPGGAKHVRFVSADAKSLDLTGKAVVTDNGRFPYDRLIIATGAELTLDHVEGLSAGGYDLYAMESVLRMKQALAGVEAGRVVVAIAGTPYKCPPAPFEYAILIEELLRRQGVRDACEVVVASPEPQPMKVAGPEVGQQVAELLASRGIDFLPKHRLVKVNGGRAHFEGAKELEFVLLGAVPKHRAPLVVREAGLTDATGFVAVELGTFRTEHNGVFAIGDVAGIQLPGGSPHPKAGVFAELQGAAVAHTIAQEVNGGSAPAYLGHGVCFVDVGGGQAAMADANLLAPGGPRFRLDPPGEAPLDAKAAFERERLARWFGPE